MVHAGLDLSRKRLDVVLLAEDGRRLRDVAVGPDADGLRSLARWLDEWYGEPVKAAIESMTGARFVHDQLELAGWEVEIADAQKVKGLAPLACKTDRIDAGVLAELSRRELVPAIWLPDPEVRGERERPAGGCTWSGTGPRSRTGSTRRRSASATPARSATSLAPAGVNSWRGWRCLSPGTETCSPPWN